MRIRDYLIKFSDETGKFPLEYACDDIQKPIPGFGNTADSFVAYLTRRINITRGHVRGMHATSAACVLPTNYLNLPIISMPCCFAADQHERVQRWYQSQNEHDRNRTIISTSLVHDAEGALAVILKANITNSFKHMIGFMEMSLLYTAIHCLFSVGHGQP